MRKESHRFCLTTLIAIVGLLLSCADSFSQATAQAVVCDHIEESDYDIETRIVPYSSGVPGREDDMPPWLIEEYGVLYNLAQMHEEYEIPTTLKAFAVENGINGVEIVPNIGKIYNSDAAVIQKTIEGKLILTVSQNIADKPKKIIRRLMGIDDAGERRGRDLHSLVDVDQEDTRWNARFAQAIQRLIDRFTGEVIGTKINFKKVRLQKGGSFNDMFAKQQRTMIIKGQAPFDFDLHGLEQIIPLSGDVSNSLVLFISNMNKNVVYPGELYFSERGALYSCQVEY